VDLGVVSILTKNLKRNSDERNIKKLSQISITEYKKLLLILTIDLNRDPMIFFYLDVFLQ